jgi:hypothetical protein
MPHRGRLSVSRTRYGADAPKVLGKVNLLGRPTSNARHKKTVEHFGAILGLAARSFRLRLGLNEPPNEP